MKIVFRDTSCSIFRAVRLFKCSYVMYLCIKLQFGSDDVRQVDQHTAFTHLNTFSRLCLECDSTRADTSFRLSAKRTSPFKWAGGRQFSRLLAAEVCASAVVMLDTPCSEVVSRVLATHSVHQFTLHFPSRASPCVIMFQLDSTTV